MYYPSDSIPAPWDVSKVRGDLLIDHRHGNQCYFQPQSKMDAVANVTGKTVICAGIGAVMFLAVQAALNS